ncbi:MAG TPA: hypothetical protein ENJ95_11715 [Bacteroidetes bacterium]|nr:hypothetical protein [Bacteroidota bacterium]
MRELKAAVLHLKSTLQQEADLHHAEEEFHKLYFRLKGEFPSASTGASFPQALFDLIRDTVAIVKPGREAYLKAEHIKIQQMEDTGFCCGIYFLKSDFITFFYFRDIDKGALTFSRNQKPLQYVPLSRQGLQTGHVPEMKEINVFGEGGILEQVRPPSPPPKKSAMDKKIRQLKTLTTSSKSLSDPFHLFFDLAEAHPNYFRDGNLEEDEDIAQMIARTMGEMVGKSGFMFLDQVVMVSLPRHSLVHGSCTCLNRMVVFYFFQDIGVGILASSGGSRKTVFARMTTIATGKPGRGPRNPPPSSKLFLN